MSPLAGQLIDLFAAMMLLLAFAMLSQRRVLTLIHLFALQGAALVASTAVVGYATQQPHLYVSAGITLALKVFLIPWLLHRVINRLSVRWDVETLINIPTTMLIGIVLVIFAFNIAAPIAQLSTSVARGTFGIGTDSNVRIGVPGELRQLEYSQRLRDRARNVLAAHSAHSTGRTLFANAHRGGERALGMSGPVGLGEGAAADCVSLRIDLAAPAGTEAFHRFAVSDDEARFLQVGSRFVGDRLESAELVAVS